MRNRLPGLAVVVLAYMLGVLTTSRLTRVHAQAQEAPRLMGTSTAPKEWGAFRGVSDKFLVFEDGAGTIRMAFIESGVHNFHQVDRR